MSGPFADAAWAIDSSFDALTFDEALALVDAGVQVYAQCLWTGNQQPAGAEQSLAAARAAGLLTVGYVSVAPGHDGEWHVQQARIRISGTAWDLMLMVFLDVELTGLSYAQHVVPGKLGIESRGKRAAIYTNYNTWVNLLGNPQVPADWELWDASWGIGPEQGFFPRSYGGFQEPRVVARQYTGGEDVLGQYADRDIFRLSLLQPPPPPAPEDWVDHITQHFHSGKVWEFDVVPPPGVS